MERIDNNNLTNLINKLEKQISNLESRDLDFVKGLKLRFYRNLKEVDLQSRFEIDDFIHGLDIEKVELYLLDSEQDCYQVKSGNEDLIFSFI